MKIHRSRSALPAVLALFASACVAPGEEPQDPISTDRPGFLFAPTVVPTGRLQVEVGLPSLVASRESGDEDRVWSFPVAARYGLQEDLELRASLPTWTEVRDETDGSVERDEGFADAEVGVKLALPPIGPGPLALVLSLRLPTGDDGFSTDEPGGSAFLVHGRDVGGGTWFQGMLGLSHLPADDADDATIGALAALLSHPLQEGWSAYVEGAALPGLEHAPDTAFAGGGLIWAPASDLQLDLSFDFGLTDDSSDLLAGLGLSWFF